MIHSTARAKGLIVILASSLCCSANFQSAYPSSNCPFYYGDRCQVHALLTPLPLPSQFPKVWPMGFSRTRTALCPYLIPLVLARSLVCNSYWWGTCVLSTCVLDSPMHSLHYFSLFFCCWLPLLTALVSSSPHLITFITVCIWYCFWRLPRLRPKMPELALTNHRPDPPLNRSWEGDREKFQWGNFALA